VISEGVIMLKIQLWSQT